MTATTALDSAYSEQLCKLYRIFAESVCSAKDHNAELVAAGERFRAGVLLLKQIDGKTREIVQSEAQ